MTYHPTPRRTNYGQSRFIRHCIRYSLWDFDEEPCTEIVDEVVAYIDDTDIDEDQAIELIQEICHNMELGSKE